MRSFATIALRLCAAAIVIVGATAVRAAPLKIRAAYVVAPASLLPILFPEPGIAKHQGKSYVLDVARFSSTTPIVTGIANGELDVVTLGFSTLPFAVLNAGLDDLRVIADQMQDGVEGYFSGSYMVLKDSPIKTVKDLKGKVIGTNGIGSGADVIMRAELLKQGLVDKRDYSTVEVQFPNMRAMLAAGKIDLAALPLPFVNDPELQKIGRTLFLQKEALGATEMSFLAARSGFLEKNRAAITDFMEDYLRSVHWYMAPSNHAKAVQTVANFTKLPAASLDSWLFTGKDYYREPNGLVNVESLHKTTQALKELGFVASDLDVAKHADLSFIKDAVARTK